MRANSFGNKYIAVLVLTALLTISISFAASRPARAQVRPVYDMGAIGLVQALKRLQTTASVLHTAAHPDDEDSGLLAYLARGEHARTAYLSLTRGDGGQNVIGEELFEALGVIRTEELLQARRLDGGSQLFASVMDYGFSKKRDEAARIWGERETLGDMVRAIRLYKPLVVISRFAGSPADGHGQHQLAGYLTPLAFKAAGDPNEFPEHMREGLNPWQAKKLYVSQSFVQNAQNVPTLVLNTGEYDRLIGRSYFEIAMEGRSQHKSQEMGMLELRGKQNSGLRLAESVVPKVEKETSVFDGIDVSIKGIADLTNNREPVFVQRLAELQAAAEEALKSYDPLAPEKLVPVLAKGYGLAYKAETSTRNPESKTMLQRKQDEFARALMMASGVVVDALADAETVIQGGSTNVAVRVFAPEGSDVKAVKSELRSPKGWSVESIQEPPAPPATGFRPRREEAAYAAFFRAGAPADAELTQPYWLERPRKGFTFDWSGADGAKNMPFADPLLIASVTLNIGGEEVTAERVVRHRFADDIRGEIRREVSVVPHVALGLESNLLIAPTSATARKHRLVMTVTNNAPQATFGTARFSVPAGWTLTPASASFDLPKQGDKTALSFDVTVPAGAKPDAYKLAAVAEVGGKRFSNKVQEIAYPHIQTHRIYSPADVTAQVVDLKVAPVKVGYIMGSGDKVPEAIKRLGLDVTMLGEKDLSTGNLGQFDTIVVGIRASQVRPDMVANNGRLIEFMKNGGSLIVQYQQQEYIRENLPPYPAKMERNVRVTDENAEVRILRPDHAVFNFPNRIGDRDWLNWVQERNLYSFSDFDASKYTPLLESHDEGEAESTGGMVYAEVGKGRFVYTSYSWFRQLPAGNPGAYRLFANLLSLPKAK